MREGKYYERSGNWGEFGVGKEADKSEWRRGLLAWIISVDKSAEAEFKGHVCAVGSCPNRMKPLILTQMLIQREWERKRNKGNTERKDHRSPWRLEGNPDVHIAMRWHLTSNWQLVLEVLNNLLNTWGQHWWFRPRVADIYHLPHLLELSYFHTIISFLL